MSNIILNSRTILNEGSQKRMLICSEHIKQAALISILTDISKRECSVFNLGRKSAFGSFDRTPYNFTPLHLNTF